MKKPKKNKSKKNRKNRLSTYMNSERSESTKVDDQNLPINVVSMKTYLENTRRDQAEDQVRRLEEALAGGDTIEAMVRRARASAAIRHTPKTP